MAKGISVIIENIPVAVLRRYSISKPYLSGFSYTIRVTDDFTFCITTLNALFNKYMNTNDDKIISYYSFSRNVVIHLSYFPFYNT